MKSLLRTTLALLVALTLAVGLPLPAQARQTPISATETAMWQTNGTVRTLAYANGKVFVGGEFTSVRPPGAAAGANEVARPYLAVFDAATGALVTSFDAASNGKVYALEASPDGTRVYAGGDFTTLGGKTHRRLAAINTSTLAVDHTFNPNVAYRVTAIGATRDKVYFGGSFGAVNNETRTRAAAVTTAGVLLPWNPSADGDIAAVEVAPDEASVYIGGAFSSIGGNPQRAIAHVDAAAGANLPFPAASAMPPLTSGCDARVREIIRDADSIYVASAGDGGGCFDGTFSASIATGELRWKNNCLGATEALALIGGSLYKGSHAHNCSFEGAFPEGPNRMLLAQNTQSGKIEGWYPTTNGAGTTRVGPFAMATDGTRLWVGGDFTTVNGKPQQGVGLFGPTPQTNPERPLTPTSASARSGVVKTTFKTTVDADDEKLTYRVYRSGVAEPVLTQDIESRFWDRPSVTFQEEGLAPGSKVAYRVEATDGVGTVTSYWTPYVTVSDATLSYAETVKADGADLHWRLEETSGTTAADAVGTNAGTLSGVALGQTGITPGSSAAGLSAGGSRISSSNLLPNPATFSTEAWIKTTTKQGGRILGFGNQKDTTSSNYDRHLYMRNDGVVNFGAWTGSAAIVSSKKPLNDGVWHHVLTSVRPGAVDLYVDGVLQESRVVPAINAYTGYWRVGADNLSGWPGQPSSAALQGSIDEVAVYPTALSAVDAAWHFQLGIGNTAPDAQFTASCVDLTCSFDASASTDAEGGIASYAWDLGDGNRATDRTASHTYATAGTYQVTLTVTDDRGVKDTSTQAVEVKAPNTAPKAAFTASCNGADCAFDASTSADAEGAIASYSWNFGDGASGSGRTATHAYGESGTYDVGLQVTDGAGLTATSSQQVTVVIPVNTAPTASFTAVCENRTCTFDGSASADPEGAVAGWDWSFGDGSAQSGQVVTRTFAANGTYTVDLTVRDAQGLSATSRQQVTVRLDLPAGTPLVQDAFDRTLSSGLGTANLGGAWRISGSSTRYSVEPSAGILKMLAPGNAPAALVPGVVSSATETRMDAVLDKPATGGGVYVTLTGRAVEGQGEYRAKLRYISSGRVYIALTRSASDGSEVYLTSEVLVPGLTGAPGERLTLKMLASGVGSTDLKAKVWAAGTSEPAAWQVGAVDTTASLQAEGSVGVRAQLSGSAVNAPVWLRVSNFLATTPR
ncbi:PKD domain-containing protein [Arthrobacter sp. CP30]